MILRRLTVPLRLALAALLVAGAAFGAETKPAPRPALWKIHNGASTVYLFGSLHILPSGYSWTTPQIEAALSVTDRFILEVPLDEQALEEEKQFILANGFLPPGRSLQQHLTQPEFRRYARVLKNAGLDPQQFVFYRPWLASIMVGLAYLHPDDLKTLKGADEAIMEYAVAHGKQTGFLERIEDQLALITQGTERAQLSALKRLISRLSRSRSHQKELLESWSSGDADRFSTYIQGYFKERAEAKDFLIDGRNRNWVAPIKQYLESGNTTFVTVGAAHIGGEQGLLRLLCGEGYDVERVGDAAGAGAKICGPKA